MDEKIHVIITGDRGKVLTWLCQKKKLRILTTLAAALLLILIGASTYSLNLWQQNRKIASQLEKLHEQLSNSAELFAEQQRISEEQQLKLNLKLAKLELDSVRQAVAFRDEKETMISTAVSELTERSELIEKIVGSIGINLPKADSEKNDNSGGPFVLEQESKHDELLFRADRYLKTIQFLPVGRPVDGEISSRFGKRKDPINGKRAFHTGLDFRAEKGDKVYATADGVVQKAHRNGGYGNYLLIDHGNGYQTGFGHLHSFLVKPGDRVKRGEEVALVGNSGRTTGAHLHYEVSLNEKFINPYNFMKFDELSNAEISLAEK